jgi:integrase
VWLPAPAQKIIADLSESNDVETGFVFAGKRGGAANMLDRAAREACALAGIDEKVTPHDLRRTHGSLITALGFGRDAMNRIQNHKEGGIADVYDRHHYAEENSASWKPSRTRSCRWSKAGPTSRSCSFQ